MIKDEYKLKEYFQLNQPQSKMMTSFIGVPFGKKINFCFLQVQYFGGGG